MGVRDEVRLKKKLLLLDQESRCLPLVCLIEPARSNGDLVASL